MPPASSLGLVDLKLIVVCPAPRNDQSPPSGHNLPSADWTYAQVPYVYVIAVVAGRIRSAVAGASMTRMLLPAGLQASAAAAATDCLVAGRPTCKLTVPSRQLFIIPQATCWQRGSLLPAPPAWFSMPECRHLAVCAGDLD
jgi:hypothetical protein